MPNNRSWKVKDLGVLQHRHHQGGAIPANPQQGTHLSTADLPHYLTSTMGFSPFGLYVGADLLLLRAVNGKGVRIRAGPVRVRQAALIILTMAVKHQEGACMVVIVATVRLGPS